MPKAVRLTEAQWKKISRYFPVGHSGRGAPPRWEARELVEASLWILKTGSQWEYLPEEYPPRSTSHRWFQRWAKSGAFRRAWAKLVRELDWAGALDLREGYIDGSFASAKKGGSKSAPPNAAKG